MRAAVLVALLLAPGLARAQELVLFSGAMKIDLDGQENGGLYLMRPNGTDVRKLTNYETLNFVFQNHSLDLPDDHGACRPDGKRVVFATSRFDDGGVANPDNLEIATMDVKGRDVVRLTDHPARDTNPVYTPNGQRIVFASNRVADVFQIFIMNADGTNVQQLTSGGNHHVEPAVSPDGTKIAFTEIGFSALGLAFTQKDVFLMNLDGSNVRQLTDKLGEDHDAAFSPDGTRLAISTERGLVPDPPFGDTFIIDVAKGTSDDGFGVTPWPFGMGDPAWSKTGNRLLVFAADGPVLTSPMRLHTFDALTGENRVALPPQGLINVHPSWCPIADSDLDGRPDYLENDNRLLAQADFTAGEQSGDRMGSALALPDLNQDGFPDLVVGVPGETLSGLAGAGRILVVAGSALGPDFADVDLPRRMDATNAQASRTAGGNFGRSLVACDFDGDEFDDLAVGAPGQNQVFVLGAPTGWQTLAGTGEFGAALAAGDFNGDGFCDLAVGAPSELSLRVAGGAVRIYAGSASGLPTQATLVVRQSALPVGDRGGVEAGDRFGAVLAAGRINGDARADLVVGVPGETIGGVAGAGAIHVLFGTAAGLLDQANAHARDLRNLPAGDTSLEASAGLGSSLAIGHFRGGSGPPEVAVGVPGRAGGQGRVALFRGSAISTTPTLDATATAFGPSALPAALQGRLGEAMVAGDFTGDSVTDLAVSALGLANAPAGAGVVALLPGSATPPSPSCDFCVGVTPVFAGGAGIAPSMAQLLTEASVTGAPEAGDGFGVAPGASPLAAGDIDADGQDDLFVGIPGEDVGAAANSGRVGLRFGVRVGVPVLTPTVAVVAPGEPLVLRLSWAHPEQWRQLETLHVRLKGDDGIPLWVRFEEASGEIALFDVATGAFGPADRIGAEVTRRTPWASLEVGSSTAAGTGPAGRALELELAMTLGAPLVGHRFDIELYASDDHGNSQGFEAAGSVEVRAPAIEAEAGCGCHASRGHRDLGVLLVLGLALVVRQRTKSARKACLSPPSDP